MDIVKPCNSIQPSLSSSCAYQIKIEKSPNKKLFQNTQKVTTEVQTKLTRLSKFVRRRTCLGDCWCRGRGRGHTVEFGAQLKRVARAGRRARVTRDISNTPASDVTRRTSGYCAVIVN